MISTATLALLALNTIGMALIAAHAWILGDLEDPLMVSGDGSFPLQVDACQVSGTIAIDLVGSTTTSLLYPANDSTGDQLQYCIDVVGVLVSARGL